MGSSYTLHYNNFPVDDDSINVYERGMEYCWRLNNNKVQFLLQNKIIES